MFASHILVHVFCYFLLNLFFSFLQAKGSLGAAGV